MSDAPGTAAAWPPPYAGGATLGGPHGYPPRGWPSLGQLTWTREAATVLLLVLALPWLVSKLITRPGDVLSGLGARAAGKVVS